MIRLNDLNFSYGETPSSFDEASLKQISLAIKPGECVVLTGKSGSGKSTLLKLINGIIPHLVEGDVQGDISVQQSKPSKCEIQELAASIGSVFQNPKSQFFHLNTTDEVCFACTNLCLEKADIQKRVDYTVKTLAIENLMDRDIFRLSGGEKQRIACAGVFAHQPKVYLLDEPSSNLDKAGISALKGIITKLKAQGATLLIAEHRLYYLMDIADRIVHLKAGCHHRDYTSKELFSQDDVQRRQDGLRTLNAPVIDARFHKDSKGDNDQMTALQLSDLSVYYGKNKALSIAQMRIKQNAITAIIGGNGTGKSTFAKALCGLLKSTGQLALICPKSAQLKQASRRECNQRVFMVLQDVNHQLFTESVLDELLLGHAHSDDNIKKARDILATLDLLDYQDKHPLALSGGQKQRVAIASAIFSECEFLIFDEPTSGLDYEHMLRFSGLVQSIKPLTKAIIIITHDIELINLCCDEIIDLETHVVD